MRIAVVGAGITGLACAWSLEKRHRDAQVTLFEANDWLGGHANTVDVTLDGLTHGVDTGFLVFNPNTYPKLVALFKELGVHATPTDMSFSVQAENGAVQWAGSNLNTIFSQRKNLLRPAFLKMIADILRFNKQATQLAATGEDAALAEPVGRFLARENYSKSFCDWYLLPMVGAIWSCSTQQMKAFPVGALIRFCHNHGLLQATGRPQWRTVTGGSREYVKKMRAALRDARSGAPVLGVKRRPDGVAVESARGVEAFDRVVLACHSDESLALLDDATEQERAVLGSIHYTDNRATLHTDASVLPMKRAWSAWNYESAPSGLEGGENRMCVHYLISQLQPLPFQTPVIVSLNAIREPKAELILREHNYRHPLFDQKAIDAQKRLPDIQGVRGVWFAGAWTGYGFHEDGLRSGLEAADAVSQSLLSPFAREAA